MPYRTWPVSQQTAFSPSLLQTIPEGTKKRKHDPVSMTSQPHTKKAKKAKKAKKNEYMSSEPPVLDNSSDLQASDASNAPALVPLAPHIHCPPPPDTPGPLTLMQQDPGLPPTILSHIQSSEQQEVPTIAQAAQSTPMLLLTNITTSHTAPATAAPLVHLSYSVIRYPQSLAALSWSLCPQSLQVWCLPNSRGLSQVYNCPLT
ncbi:hypothetical protein K439DRAFT_1612863 [Ramaria rubella]|nr:hypothetical protein K439DRAFT_1612863 [Ramaria rubella]